MKRIMQKVLCIAIMVVSFGIYHGAAEEKPPLMVFAGPNISAIAFKVDVTNFWGSMTAKERESALGFTAGIGFKPRSIPGSTLTLGYTYHGKFTPDFVQSYEILGFPVHERTSGNLHVHTLDLGGRWEIFDNDNAFQPYLSVALGVAHVKGKINDQFDVNLGSISLYGSSTYNIKKTAFVGGVGGGFRYALTDKISMTMDYLYQSSSTMKQKIEGVDYSLRMSAHKLSLGFNLTF